MKASNRFKIVHKFTKKEFWGRYKGHDVQITRESKRSDPAQFYIGVTSPEGYLAYDGYWPRSSDYSLVEPTMEAAIEQALVGSELLKLPAR